MRGWTEPKEGHINAPDSQFKKNYIKIFQQPHPGKQYDQNRNNV